MVTLPQGRLEKGELPDKRCAVPGPRRSEYDDVCYLFCNHCDSFIRAWQARESARYHEKKGIYVATEHKRGMKKLSQQLQQTQDAMAAMQREKMVWRDQQLVLMHEEYNHAIKEHAAQLQIENQNAMQLVQQGDDDTEA